MTILQIRTSLPGLKEILYKKYISDCTQRATCEAASICFSFQRALAGFHSTKCSNLFADSNHCDLFDQTERRGCCDSCEDEMITKQTADCFRLLLPPLTFVFKLLCGFQAVNKLLIQINYFYDHNTGKPTHIAVVWLIIPSLYFVCLFD